MTSTPIRVLFIAGSARSGSTLLEQLLAPIDDFVACGEVRYFFDSGLRENHLCSCEQAFSECRFWSEVARYAVDDGLDLEALLATRLRVDRMRYIPAILSPLKTKAFAERHREYLAALDRLYRAIQRVAGPDKVIIDGSKDLSTLYLLRQLPSIELSILHLIRDPHGVVYSWSKAGIRRPGITNREAFMPVYDYRKTAIEWVVRNLLAEAARAPRRKLVRVRYEDLIENPRSTVRRVCEAVLGRSPKIEGMEGSTVEIRDCAHQIGGNPARFRSGRLELELDEEWREKLPASRRRVVSALTAPLLSRYGYLSSWR